MSEPDSTALRVALWRALHAQIDPPPHVIMDEIGFALAAPDEGWRDRGDMHPDGTKLFRASIVARARFLDDLVIEEAARGVEQYVILGAGLDSLAQRKAQIGVTIFEVDQPGPQEWKRKRLIELGYGVPDRLRLVPVDFERQPWIEALRQSGFDVKKPTIVSSTGVSLYLTREANAATLRDVATLAPGSIFVMSFMLPPDLVDPALRPGLEMAQNGARAAGTPFISAFSPDEILGLAREAGLKNARHVSAADLAQRYFTGRTDGLKPLAGEELMLAQT